MSLNLLGREKPIVSIIIPFWNSRAWLKRSIQSALQQSWKHTEIILINDGSTDDSLTIAKSFENSNIRIYTQANQGASAARNMGLSKAKGSFIQFLDADDELSPNKISKQLEKLDFNANIEAVCTCRYGITKGNSVMFYPDSLWRDLNPSEWLQTSYFNSSAMPTSTWLCPTKVLRQAGDWDPSLTLNDDGEYFARVVTKTKEVKFSMDATCYYHADNEYSLGSRSDIDSLTRMLVSIDKCANTLLEFDCSKRSRIALSKLYSRYALKSYINCSYLSYIAEKKAVELSGTPVTFETRIIHSLAEKILGWRTLYLARKKLNRGVNQ